MKNLELNAFFDKTTFTLTYCVFDTESKDAILIDPVLDYDQASSEYSFTSINKVKAFIEENDLDLLAIIETHAHADHLSGAAELKKIFSHAKVGIGHKITKVQAEFKEVFNLKNLKTDASQFEILFNEDEIISFGTIHIKTYSTPGHTPACSSYLIGDMLFVGDALFMPDYGTGRCDFPGGSARDLYHSIHNKLYKLPDETRVFTGHDYSPGGRDMAFESTIGEQKKNNIQLKYNTSEEDYILFREKRDSTLTAPKLLLPSIQLNINGGVLPSKAENGMAYLKIPISEKKNV